LPIRPQIKKQNIVSENSLCLSFAANNACQLSEIVLEN